MLRFSALLALLLASGASAQPDSTAAPEARSLGTSVAVLQSPRVPGPRVALTLDPSLSSETGSDALIAAHRGLTELEDRYLPARLWREEGVARKAGGVVYRLARLALLDEPLAHVTFLAQHEVFGHGARIREFENVRQGGYEINLPFPYGDGSGLARFGLDGPITLDQRQIFSHNGSHSTDILAEDVRESAFRRGRMRQGEALLYLHGALDLANYLNTTTVGASGSNDVESWRFVLNDRAARDGREPLALAAAQRTTLVALLDPVLYASAATVAWSYLAKGDASGPLPIFSVRGARVMPSVRMGWSPHGTQAELALLGSVRGRYARVSARHTLGGPYAAWQAGAELTPVLTRGPLALGLSADVWRSPDLQIHPQNSDAFSMDWGGALTARADVDLWRGRGGLRAEIGAKTEGLVRGEEIGAGPIVRLGVFLRA